MFNDYARFYDDTYNDKPYAEEAKMVYDWANHPKLILDVGCGTGRHAIHWADKAKVVAVDKSREMLRVAKKHKNIEYHHKDIAFDLSFNRQFDAVFSMFNVIGYLDKYAVMMLMKNLPIKKGGAFIFDCWDYDTVYGKSNVRTVERKGFRRVSTIKHHAEVKISIYDSKGDIASMEIHPIYSYSENDIRDFCMSTKFELASVKRTKTWTMWCKLVKA